jgi:2-keto-4-pentenoate hydratase/2-oxohepta-3-ene-1,7-dioic acid hydratase in catechol pathway
MLVTGTPAGVGWSRKPPQFLKAGDAVEVESERIGVLRNPVVDEWPQRHDGLPAGTASPA